MITSFNTRNVKTTLKTKNNTFNDRNSNSYWFKFFVLSIFSVPDSELYASTNSSRKLFIFSLNSSNEFYCTRLTDIGITYNFYSSNKPFINFYNLLNSKNSHTIYAESVLNNDAFQIYKVTEKSENLKIIATETDTSTPQIELENQANIREG